MRFICCLLTCLFFSVSIFFTNAQAAAPKAELIGHWAVNDEQSTQTVDHTLWQQILDQYLDKQHISGVNRFDYQKLKAEALPQLEQYLDYLQTQEPTTLNTAEQKAYWINLYNATTVHLVTTNLPVQSIKNINPFQLSIGLGLGPWNMKLLEIESMEVSLNNIEHGILRPIWQDSRLHYALNCASIGCPNLLKTAFTANNTTQLLDKAAADYINHPRAVTTIDDKLVLSSIYKWYLGDFGGDIDTLITHLSQFANPELQQKLNTPFQKFEYVYDWALNKP